MYASLQRQRQTYYLKNSKNIAICHLRSSLAAESYEETVLHVCLKSKEACAGKPRNACSVADRRNITSRFKTKL